jgi:hypothetical protein
VRHQQRCHAGGVDDLATALSQHVSSLSLGTSSSSSSSSAALWSASDRHHQQQRSMDCLLRDVNTIHALSRCVQPLPACQQQRRQQCGASISHQQRMCSIECLLGVEEPTCEQPQPVHQQQQQQCDNATWCATEQQRVTAQHEVLACRCTTTCPPQA